MKKIAVIGAGQMGAGIAQVSAVAGLQVYLSDLSLELAEKGKAGIAKQLGKLVEKEKMTKDAADAALARLIPVAGYAAMGDDELIIEAATEKAAIKGKIFEMAGKVLAADAILASNTSSIPITRMARGTVDPARFIGLHFFNPAASMRLVEPFSITSMPRARPFSTMMRLTVRPVRKVRFGRLSTGFR